MPLILAPSATGKTYFVTHEAVKYNAPIVDGDAIIADTIGWPKKEKWWEAADKQRVHNANARVLGLYMDQYPGAIVLFNGDIDRLIPWLACCVVPPWHIHRRNAEARKAAGPTLQPTDLTLIERNRVFVLHISHKHDKPVFTTIGAAIPYVMDTLGQRVTPRAPSQVGGDDDV